MSTPSASARSWPTSSEKRARRLPDGILLVDKPAGPTSHDMVTAVRRVFDTRRVGHAGTLDPFATGLLVMLVDRATRLAQFLLALPKTYEATVRLGVTTNTDDPTGETLRTSDAWNTLAEEPITRALASLLGTTTQRPPNFSAKSVDGHRAYRRARRGEQFELESQPIEVYRLDLMERNGADLMVRAEVGSGVYIRALARDLGDLLGCGAHLSTLRRVAIGPFSVADAVSPANPVSMRTALRAPREAVAHLPTRQLDAAARAAVGHGQAIPQAIDEAGFVALLSGEELVAIAESDGEWLRPSVVLEPA